MLLDEEARDGWGFADTRFETQPDESVVLSGARYALSGKALPRLLPWFSEKLGVALTHNKQTPSAYPPSVPPSRAPAALLDALHAALGPDRVKTEDQLRLRHGHGHTASEIWAVRSDGIQRVPDVVVFPDSAAEVELLVEIARQMQAALVPYGGGTNVTGALLVPETEERPVVSVSLRNMRRCLHFDRENHTAVFEAGIVGQALEQTLRAEGFTLGHEPDSLEFSTLGGWIATNASGMKKNRYGNIEDLVLDIGAVTSQGVVSRPKAQPRESVGLRPLQYFLGSEGNLGIITHATLKIRELPEVQKYASVLFPDLRSGFAFLRDLQRSGTVPASVRLMDNTQFQFGLALKPASKGLAAELKSQAEKFFVTRIKGFDPAELCAATLVFEGSKAEVAYQASVVHSLMKAHRGLPGGASNGERGYQLTFAIAYIRDLAFSLGAIAESFETSVAWDLALPLYQRVLARVTAEHERLGLPGRPFFSGRFTQIYETGVCIYFYLGFHTQGVEDPVQKYEALEHAARDEILSAGGALSHHHGVGKIRAGFLNRIYSEPCLELQRRLKGAFDPENLFCAGNQTAPRNHREPSL
jgi:alkyldihydroxyacetonephosphate synthase